MEPEKRIQKPTPEQFTKFYDSTTAGMIALRNSPVAWAFLLKVLTSASTTPEGTLQSMAAVEIPDDVVDDFSATYSEECDAAGAPMELKDRPFLRAMIQRLIEYLVATYLPGA